MISKSTVNKRKNRQVELHQTKSLLHSKGNNQENEKAIHKIGKKFVIHIFDKGLTSETNKELLQIRSDQSLSHVRLFATP